MNSYAEKKQMQKQLQMLCGSEGDRAQRLDILRFQCDEIAEAALYEGEEEELLQQKRRFSSVEKRMRLSMQGVNLLYEGSMEQASICDGLGEAVQMLQEVVELDDTLQPLLERMDSLYMQIEDAARDWKHYTQELEADPDALQNIEERLQTIYRLKRKYGGSISAVLAFYDKVCAELELLENSEEKVAELEQNIQQLCLQMETLAQKISKIRKSTAEQVQAQVEEALHDMQMPQAKFLISIQKRKQFHIDGTDLVEFLISPNAGEDLKPLSKIASGGEMSRVMLALKTVLVDADEIGTFVFDEIDTGVSGKTARKVGEKMHVLAKKRQILCITHLPQIAAMADNHYRIEKHVDHGRTVTMVEELDEETSCMEIARLMGGENITDTTLAAAKELCLEKRK